MILTKIENDTSPKLDITHAINLGYILLCIVGIIFINDIPLSEVSNDTMLRIRTSLPSNPSFGKIFLASLFFNILLTTIYSSTWKESPRLSRLSLVVWLLSFFTAVFLYFRFTILFPEHNPFLFNWKLKCIAFATTTALSMVFSYFIRQYLHQQTSNQEKEDAINPQEILDTAPHSSYEIDFAEADREFLKKLKGVIMEKISDFNLNSQEVAKHMCMSEPTLRRRIQKTTDQTCAEFIREQRFEYARALLENGQILTKKELALKVGFKSVDYFSKLFENYMEQAV